MKLTMHQQHPLRMCVLCRKRHNKQQMLRFVVNNQALIIVDVEQSLLARGYYLCQNPQHLAVLKKKADRQQALRLRQHTVAVQPLINYLQTETFATSSPK